jgi:predicted PurR-regulated permease PerM
MAGLPVIKFGFCRVSASFLQRRLGGEVALSTEPLSAEVKPAGEVEIRREGNRQFLVLHDAQPIGDRAFLWQRGSQVAIVGIFAILLVAALSLGRPVLLPVTAALVMGMVLGPLARWASKIGVPNFLGALALWLLVFLVFNGLIVMLSAPIVDWLGRAQEIGLTIQDKLYVLKRPIEALYSLRDAIMPPTGDEKSVKLGILDIAQPALQYLTPALTQLLIFFATLFFVLLGRARMRHALVTYFDARDARLRALRILNDIERNLTAYFGLFAIINVFVGIGAAAIALAVGLPNPLAWGVLGFILNFLPYLGALIMELAMFGVGLVTFPTAGYALIAPLLYLALNILEGEFVTPAVIGRRLTLIPLAVILSLVFWTWLWGPVGAFLAVPLLIIGLVTLNHVMPSDEPSIPE